MAIQRLPSDLRESLINELPLQKSSYHCWLQKAICTSEHSEMLIESPQETI